MKSKPRLLRRGVEFARDVGRRGGVVDEDLALADAFEGAVLAQRNGAHVIVVADAHHHEVLAFRGFAWRLGGAAAVFGNPLFGLGEGAVVDGDVVPAFLLEMPGHRVAHHAETEKRHFRHRPLLNVRVAACDCAPRARRQLAARSG